jgi:hypothetical protein
MSEHVNPDKSYRRATVVASLVLGAGLIASLAGNVQSILLEDGAPGVGALISAVWWPIILFGMIELAIHTPWDTSTRDELTRWVGVLAIGLLAFYISYFHLAHVLSSFGYDVASRYAGPFAVDLAMVVATVALNRVGQVRKQLVATEARGHEEVAEPLSLASQPLPADPTPVATPGQEVASTPEQPGQEVAADFFTALCDDQDWATGGNDLDAELAELIAQAQIREPEPEQEPEPEPESEQEQPPAVKLTPVPARAAKMIRTALEQGMIGKELDAYLVAEGVAPSTRSARRWRAALANGTARVS